MSRHLLLSYLLRASRVGDGASDAELLRRFAEDRDEAAFELLVRRHADTVWKVCRGVARQPADAEDAFQATFLALARRAGAVHGPTAAGFLHRVAVHAALKARAIADRLPAPLSVDVPAPTRDDRPDFAAVHEEVARLPDRYRLPVVLCDLEGHTHAEAAAQLGWPIGTVSGRLSRARVQLRDRLERRGIAGVVAGIVLVGADRLTAGADLIRASVLVGVGGRPVPVAVASLTQGVLTAMSSTKQIVAAVAAVIGVGVAGTGTAWVLAQDREPDSLPTPARAAKRPPSLPAEEKWPPPSDFPDIPRLPHPAWKIDGLMPKVLPTDTPATRNRKRKLFAAYAENIRRTQILKLQAVGLGEFIGYTDAIIAASRAVALTAAELWDKPDDLRPWLEWRVAAAKDYEQTIIDRGEDRLGRSDEVYAAVRDRLDAELALLKLNAR